jgi:7-cyano-7-deazaguanine synthase
MDHYAGCETGGNVVRLVNLVSGGLDSTLIGVLAKEEGHEVFPLFIDYGQRAAQIEWATCLHVHNNLALPTPVRMDLSGFGQIILSGLTSTKLDIKENAFTPGRNLMFLMMGGAYAFQVNASQLAIGLLSEASSLFPDQSSDFILKSESAIHAALGRRIKVTTPLSDFSKQDVIQLAKGKGIQGTYSCHSGTESPCGVCISCLEIVSKTGG